MFRDEGRRMRYEGGELRGRRRRGEGGGMMNKGGGLRDVG